MSKKKKVITLAIGTALLLTIVPSSFGYAEESISKMLRGNTQGINELSREAKVEKLEKPIDKSLGPKTMLKNKSSDKKELITKEKAEKIAREILEEYSKVNILANTPIKTEEMADGIFETTIGVNGDKREKCSVKINKYGEVISIYSPSEDLNVSKNYSIDVDKSKKLIKEFLEEYAGDKISDINIILTKNTYGNNKLNFNLQRVYKGTKVIEEGGSISIDAEKIKLLSFDIKWSSLSFEEEIGKKISKKEAISILKDSNVVNPVYIKEGNKYKVDFILSSGEQYIIDVNKRAVKNLFKDEYTVKENIAKGIKELKNTPKTKEEVTEISLDIIKRLTGKEGKGLPVKIIEENGKRLIRSIVATASGERYYVEYNAKTFKVINIYKYGYDTIEKSKFTPIEFKEAYKKAVTAIGLIYNNEIESLSLNQNEYSLSDSRVYNFNFNRIVNGIQVNDQYISVNVDAITGEILSVFLEWDSVASFDNSKNKSVEGKRDKYLNSLKGEYVYINENGIGKLYYVLEDSKSE